MSKENDNCYIILHNVTKEQREAIFLLGIPMSESDEDVRAREKLVIDAIKDAKLTIANTLDSLFSQVWSIRMRERNYKS